MDWALFRVVSDRVKDVSFFLVIFEAHNDTSPEKRASMPRASYHL